jgi:hypothetical protein
MATRIETLGGDRRAAKAPWILLFTVVVVAAALAIGTLVRSDGATTAPPRSSTATTATALEPATQVPGLIKAGLQPRPYSAIPVEVVDATAPTVPNGFVQMSGGEVRPRFGG